jgi:AraC-like DNA-binding protein
MLSFSWPAWQELHHTMEQQGIHPDPSDPNDVTMSVPRVLGQGYARRLQLRDGLSLEIFDVEQPDQIRLQCPELSSERLNLHFHLWGHHENGNTTMGNRQFAIQTSGIVPATRVYAPAQRALELDIELPVTLLTSFIADGTGQLPRGLQHLICPVPQASYTRCDQLTPAMERVLWQVLRCPLTGMHKRLFLESKVLELVSLVLELELAAMGHPVQPKVLTADTYARLERAKQILVGNLRQPPTLSQLAHQVQLNTNTLKKGFKQAFGMTVFAYLLEQRLEQARSMLEEGQMPVAQVMAAIGLSDRTYFAANFRKRYGQTPKRYQRQYLG